MNEIRKSLDGIRATEELKQSTLQYLRMQQAQKGRPRKHPAFTYALAAICVFLLLGVGGYSVYRQPVSYISIDVNPSVELEINCFGRVVSASAYNDDGQAILRQLSLMNYPYVQAISELLANVNSFGFLKEDSVLVFTIISPQDTSIMEELSAAVFSKKYEALLYTSDMDCMEEAHSHEMSFGKYRGYQELTQYDASVTIEDCNNMTMEELHHRIESCSGHQDNTGSQHHGTSQPETQTPNPTDTPEPTDTGHHGTHHK